MKKLSILITFLFPVLSYAQEGFTVTMRIKGLGEHQIKASIQRNGKYVIDTLTKIDTDLVVWKGKTVDPQLVRVEVMDTSLYLRVGKAVMAPPALTFLLTNTDIEIEADAKQIFIGTIESKNPEVQLYNSIRNADLEDAKENWALQQTQNKKRNLNDTIGNYDITQRLQYLKKKNQAMRIQFLNDNPATFTSLLVLQSLFLILPISESETKFYALTEEQKNSNTGKSLILKI